MPVDQSGADNEQANLVFNVNTSLGSAGSGEWGGGVSEVTQGRRGQGPGSKDLRLGLRAVGQESLRKGQIQGSG